jgi:uncharacterized protein YceK
MNDRTALVLGFISIVLLGGGCGTVENLQEATQPSHHFDASWNTVYGGVSKDYAHLQESRDVTFKNPHDPWLMLLDLPFTLIGDTITLPYTIAYELGLLGVNSASKPRSDPLTPLPLPEQIPSASGSR